MNEWTHTGFVLWHIKLNLCFCVETETSFLFLTVIGVFLAENTATWLNGNKLSAIFWSQISRFYYLDKHRSGALRESRVEKYSNHSLLSSVEVCRAGEVHVWLHHRAEATRWRVDPARYIRVDREAWIRLHGLMPTDSWSKRGSTAVTLSGRSSSVADWQDSPLCRSSPNPSEPGPSVSLGKPQSITHN